MLRSLALVLTFLFLVLPIGGPVVNARRQAAAAATSGAGLVPVDVQVLDRSGKPLAGLTQADFTILEDGAPQQIRSVSEIAMTAGAAAPDAKPVLRKGISAVPQDHRIFVFALGLGRLEDPSGSISGLLKFVRTRLLPQDQVAIFAYDRALDFTTDHQKLVDALERFKKGHPNVNFELAAQLGPTGMAPLYGSRAIPKKLQTRIDELVLGPGAPPATLVTDEVLQPEQVGRISLDSFMASCATSLDDQNSLNALMGYLRYFEGKKHVIFVTEKGLLWPSDANDRAVAALANDARVSLHSIQTGGLLQPEIAHEMDATVQQAASFKSLRTMSELSGGLPAITEKGQSALDRLDEATRSGYLLGFQSSNATWDGGYRRLVVKVNRPDVTVLYRHGYYRMPGDGAFDRRSLITNDRLSAGGNFRREVDDIKVKVAVSQQSGTSLVAEGTFDLTKVKTVSAGGARVGQLNVAIYCLDRANNSMGQHSQTLSIKIPEADFERVLREGYPFRIEFPIIRGTQIVRVIVYDFGSDLIGRSDQHVH
jgi:VWFA-related protein